MRTASALGVWIFCAEFDAFVGISCCCAAVSDPCSIGCTFMGPIDGRSRAMFDNNRPRVSFLLPLLVGMHPIVRCDLLRRRQLDHVHRRRVATLPPRSAFQRGLPCGLAVAYLAKTVSKAGRSHPQRPDYAKPRTNGCFTLRTSIAAPASSSSIISSAARIPRSTSRSGRITMQRLPIIASTMCRSGDLRMPSTAHCFKFS